MVGTPNLMGPGMQGGGNGYWRTMSSKIRSGSVCQVGRHFGVLIMCMRGKNCSDHDSDYRLYENPTESHGDKTPGKTVQNVSSRIRSFI